MMAILVIFVGSACAFRSTAELSLQQTISFYEQLVSFSIGIPSELASAIHRAFLQSCSGSFLER
jgi:hypothetical protein